MAGGTPLGNMVIQLELDSTKMNDGLKRINNQLKSFERQVKAQSGIAQFYKKGTEAVQAYAKQKKALSEAFKSQGQALKLLNDKYKESVDNTKKANKEARDLGKAISDLEKRYHESVEKTGDASEASQKLGIELQKLKDEQEEVIDRTGRLNEASQKLAGQIEVGNGKLASYASQLKEVARQEALATNKMYQFGQKLAPVGQALNRTSSAFDVVSQKTRAMSLAIVGGMGLSVKAAVDFESAFTGVTKTVDEQKDANGRVIYSYDQLRKGIRNLAKEIPATTTEISNVAEAAGQLGIQAPNIVAFSKTMIGLGESTNLSATEAATALAKFRNITQMSEKDFDRLGSVIVDLGNNMATTEKDITEMGLRLASTGKLVGLSEAQIMALAASLSAVGMEAEAGGSAVSRVMQKINTAVGTGGEKLEKFASVAGLSAEQFAEKWKTSPSEAITDFVKGLGKVKDRGDDVTQTLKDLGINSIREIDSLQRLAGAGNELEKAFGRANTAWKENTALTTEANKRYGTMESKLKIFRNKLNDVAITLGGPLLEALSDGLEAAEPFIKSLADMAKGFSQMDKASQRNIIKMGLLLAAISPVAKAISGLTGVLGAGVTGLSNFSTWLGKIGAERAANEVVGQLGELASEAGIQMTNLGTATAGTTGNMGLLANASAFLSANGLLLAGTFAVAGAIAYFGAKAEEARIRTETWGTKVSQVEAEELESFKGKVDDTNKAMVDFATGATKGLEGVKSAFSDLNKEVQTLLDKKLEDSIVNAKKLGLDPDVVDEITKSAQRVKDNVQQMSDEVIAIYQNASNEHRQLTEEEKRIVLANQNALINEQLTLMKFSKKERVALQKAINGDLEGLEQEQLAKAKATLRQWITEEQKSYKELRSGYKKALSDIKGDGESAVAQRAEILAKMERLEAEHQAKLEAYGIKYGEIYQAWIEKATKGVDSSIRKTYEEELRHTLEDLGVSYEEFVERASRASNKLQEGHSMWAQTLADASDEARSANILWNEMTWDLKKGVLESNVQEKIQEALQAEQGWEGMKFILKHANLSTNAKIAIGEALVATGQWDSLTPEEKHLVVEGKPAIEALIQSKEHLAIWNSMPEEVKRILGENESFMSSADGAMQLLTAWNLLLPIDKELKAHNLTSGDVKLAQDTINSLMGKTVNIDADNRTGKPVADATNAINNALQYKPAPIDAVNQTQKPVADATDAINKVEQKAPANINAVDNASQKANNAKDALLSIPTQITSFLTITTLVSKIFKNEKGTDFHPGGLAMVNDQKGSLYKELVTLPSGESFIPKGRNVILPLPRGSKVLTASRTKHLMDRLGVPRYADGVGIPEDAKIFRDMARAERGLSSPVVVQQDTSRLEGLLKEIVYLLSRQATDKGQGRSDVYLNETKVGEMVTDYMRKKERMENRMWGISP